MRGAVIRVASRKIACRRKLPQTWVSIGRFACCASSSDTGLGTCVTASSADVCPRPVVHTQADEADHQPERGRRRGPGRDRRADRAAGAGSEQQLGHDRRRHGGAERPARPAVAQPDRLQPGASCEHLCCASGCAACCTSRRQVSSSALCAAAVVSTARHDGIHADLRLAPSAQKHGCSRFAVVSIMLGQMHMDICYLVLCVCFRHDWSRNSGYVPLT